MRLGGCNLACPWCDTPYTWDWTGVTGRKYVPAEELEWRDPLDVVDQVVAMKVDRVVLTGGEPLLQQARLGPLLDGLVTTRGMTVEVETNGTQVPLEEVARLVGAFNVSPKLGANTGMAEARRIKPAALAALAALPHSAFKFVVSGLEDAEEALDLCHDYGIDLARVWFMPLGKTEAELAAVLPVVVDLALLHGVNVSNRLHVQTWGNRRGV